tara:strand:- start:1630 stop:1833 length:204 start_codon:yes stop_codon:yes gene_type:complete
MEDNSVKKKNNQILEELSMDLKGLLNDTASIKKDIHYIKTIILMKDKVKQDLEKPNQENISVGWRLW